MRMHSQPGASNLVQKKLTPNEIIEKKDTPFERLRTRVKFAVEQYDERMPSSVCSGRPGKTK